MSCLRPLVENQVFLDPSVRFEDPGWRVYFMGVLVPARWQTHEDACAALEYLLICETKEEEMGRASNVSNPTVDALGDIYVQAPKAVLGAIACLLLPAGTEVDMRQAVFDAWVDAYNRGFVSQMPPGRINPRRIAERAAKAEERAKNAAARAARKAARSASKEISPEDALSA